MSRVAFILDEIAEDDGPASPVTLRDRIEDLLPPDCLSCGWGQPGPHDPECQLAPLLDEVEALDRARHGLPHGALRGFNSVEDIERAFGWPVLRGCRVALAVERGGRDGVFMVFQDPEGGLFEVNVERDDDDVLPWKPMRTTLGALARRQSENNRAAVRILREWGVS